MYSLLDQAEKSEEGESGRPSVRLRIAFRQFAVVTLSLPLLSFSFCIIYSLLFNFRQSTATHCGVENYLPSISSAIGPHPQKDVWKIGIVVHTLPRLLVASIYFEHYRGVLIPSCAWLARINAVINIAEILALLGLSLISSTYNHELHAACFSLFIICAIVYMALTLLLLEKFRRNQEFGIERKSRRLKYAAFLVNIVGVVSAVYLYVRHNKYCEPYVYTWFAFAEYVVVLSNMAFHATAYYDFYDTKILLTAKGVKVV